MRSEPVPHRASLGSKPLPAASLLCANGNRRPFRKVWVRAIAPIDIHYLDLKGKKKRMNATQIKDEILKLNRNEKLEIFRWIDQEVADDLVFKIGTDRSRKIRREFDLKCNVIRPERQAALRDRVKPHSAEQNAANYAV
jgi:hypothetical protein